MKKVITLCLALNFVSNVIEAQTVLSNGYGLMAAINGTTYLKISNVGTSNYGAVAASFDGTKFYAGSANPIHKLFYIDVATLAFTDSMDIPGSLGEFSTANEANTLFIAANTTLFRVNTATKAVDSVSAGSPFRVEGRPGTKEVWVAADSMVYVVDYTSGLNVAGSIKTSNSKFDNGDIRFSKGGSIAYKAAASRKKIFKIDAATRAIIDSIDTSPLSLAFAEVSTDSSKLFAGNGYKIYIFSVTSKALIDSITTTMQVFNLYRHPSRQEIWAVHHFNDSVTVYDENTKAVVAGIPIGNDPFFLAFASGTATNISQLDKHRIASLYPNPATDELSIKFASDNRYTLVITDIAGRTIKQFADVHSGTRLNISGFAKGIYNAGVYDEYGLKEQMSFIKQ